MKEILEYIRSDYHRYYGGGNNTLIIKIILLALTARNHCFTYIFWMRLAKARKPISLIARSKLRRLQKKYGIQIPYTTQIGYGFYIGHGVGIVVNGRTKIGNNVNISQFLSIGSNKGTPATIGDNVYIGPHVSIVEDVKIGDNATIGAGAVVVKDVPTGSTVAGNPAKTISDRTHPEYIQNKWQIHCQ